ncbi:hypothetical protein EV401DRAFT_1890933 [Pisolithus croceorrhizus]|nr:hypothetical protein EV401DRAFT_1890933 [Pisolithus croceorrhizus]
MANNASDDDDETYSARRQQSRVKRRKTNAGRPIATGHRSTRATASLTGILDAFQYGIQLGSTSDEETRDDECFDTVVESLLPEYLQTRHDAWARRCDINESGEAIRPLSRYETTAILDYANKKNKGTGTPSIAESIVLRKIELQRVPQQSSAPSAVLDHLRTIQSTPYENSFASRLYGSKPRRTPGLIAVDWETRTPWTNLLDDIHEHYSLAHIFANRDTLQVSDSLKYSPEHCTVIATYGHLVVGAALLSSPQETYITYLVVRAGWDNSQIATTMLYHLISLNPHRDITLHVSVDNPAMLLYNRFGFKAEEFIVGFYEDYLSSQSRASMNAFRNWQGLHAIHGAGCVILYEQSGVPVLNLRLQSSVELQIPKDSLFSPMKQSANFQQALDKDETSKSSFYVTEYLIVIVRDSRLG